MEGGEALLGGAVGRKVRVVGHRAAAAGAGAGESVMGPVSDYLWGMIARQVRERGLVVWYDPDGHYRDFAAALELPEAVVARYEGSFYALRHQIEARLTGFEPPPLVLYVPRDREATGDALLEVESLGVVMRPG